MSIITYDHHLKKLSNDPSKIPKLHTTIRLKIDMLMDLCTRNYVIIGGLVNGAHEIFKLTTKSMLMRQECGSHSLGPTTLQWTTLPP